MAIFRRSRAAPEPFDATRYATSWLLSPFFFGCLRLLFSLFAFATLFFTFGWDCTHSLCESAEHSFSYFTDLTYWGLAFYYLFAALHSLSYAIRGRAWLEGWGRVLGWLHGVFYSTITVFPFLVTIVFFALLFEGSFTSTTDAYRNISMHGLNSLYALVEIILPRTPPHPWLHLVPIILILAAYLGLAYLTYHLDGFYVYDFLDDRIHSRGIVAAYCIGILVGTCIVFVIVRYVIWARVWLTERRWGMEGKFSRRDGMRTRSRDVEMVHVRHKG
ncbi:hypothetical protein M501DRAFT_1033588 [Patellaria atrata CBS 101060]|uniref:FAR-17a/AIG1-like protein n=1 Tax=Patellaria atrata CBS 101060 TaxID=1346257 RepID=A0A9P4VQF6_9PEZI|nr:hypothetical protein M501DRAFT_1033588 [Patellaria atrata CBS 101060]